MVEFDVPGFQIRGEDYVVDAGGGPTDEDGAEIEVGCYEPCSVGGPPQVGEKTVERVAGTTDSTANQVVPEAIFPELASSPMISGSVSADRIERSSRSSAFQRHDGSG